MDVMIPLDRGAKTSLSDQIYNELRSSIATCRISATARLPSTRELARQLGVARFTVDDAYARLTAEGYVIGRHGSGTYVVDHPQLAKPDPVVDQPQPEGRRALSRWGRRLPSHKHSDHIAQLEFNLEAGTPGLDEFPWSVWRRLQSREARNQSRDTQTYGPDAGSEDLREAIAAYLARSRRLHCTPDQVVVTTGLHQSLDILIRLLMDPGDRALIEDPCYPFVRTTLTVAGAHVTPVPVDGDGLQVDQLPRGIQSAKVLYTTPSHQYPTGSILSLQRRLDVIAWSEESGALIVEDDYDSELRYDARPVPSLTGLARERNHPGNVVYTGSFSKVLFPGVRLGYIVLPPDLVSPYLQAKRVVDRHPPMLSQATVAVMITEGHFERHLARMRRLYASRQTALVDAIERYLPGIVNRDVEATSAGLHLLVRMDVTMSERSLIQLAADHGIQLYGAGDCFATPPPQPHLLLGFSAMPEERITAGIERLARVLKA